MFEKFLEVLISEGAKYGFGVLTLLAIIYLCFIVLKKLFDMLEGGRRR